MSPPKVTNPVRMTWKNYQMQNSKDSNYVQTSRIRKIVIMFKQLREDMKIFQKNKSKKLREMRKSRQTC